MDKKKILVVDDEEAFTRSVRMNLESLYDIRVVNKGASVCAVVRDFKPDLILLDVMMPDMDGCEVLRELKERVYGQDIPVVFITALVAKSKADHKTRVNDSPCLAKPVSLEELTTCIEANLRKTV